MKLDLTLTNRETLPSERLEVRNAILDLQQSLVDCPDDIKVDLKVQHYFANGVYGREMFIPEGVCVVGKIHKYACINVISAGKVRVVTEYGSEDYTAPDTFVSIPGSKRAVYALEDTIWTTFHPCKSENLEEIEEDLIAKDYDELSLIEEKL